MADIARACGFEGREVLTESSATAQAVLDRIEAVGRSLRQGDFFLLTFSGHGSQRGVDHIDPDEPDNMDETLVMFDREIIDNELLCRWLGFAAGVRIVMVEDACHSGTSIRLVEFGDSPLVKSPPPGLQLQHLEENEPMYRRIVADTTQCREADVRASVMLLGACQDHQTTTDGDPNGAFTAGLLQVWRESTFTNYRDFLDKIKPHLAPLQTPSLCAIGPRFDGQRPFTI